MRIVDEVGAQHGFAVVRVGMHPGPAVRCGTGWFGATVRCCCPPATARAAGQVPRARCVERGAVRLRNVTEPVVLLAARADAPPTESAMVIDPVCRMAISPAGAAGQLSYSTIS